ncbi:MAG: hypothetical protein GWM90_02730 [Gemmatimonadetes bacterium]|nr:hypothetical protein [Gemmatimonadota bacterium]NIQ52535.1 hypothetical protein [Gemmatimonadota bacterium]NIU72673.1 hypothetical protein [Gammaproteobacteria bacterium]NIX43079.1 hypothetical protein [Gemmatimonadota bacterium]NIY07239.1 hypothetical protein [Gemmatimonadota bacterium]
MSKLNVTDPRSIANLIREFAHRPIRPRRLLIGVRQGGDAPHEVDVEYPVAAVPERALDPPRAASDPGADPGAGTWGDPVPAPSKRSARS